MKNWAGNHEFQAGRWHFPQSTEEVQALVARCEKVRVAGTRHSFNDIADCAGADLISLKHLDRVLGFDLTDPASPSVTVEAGMTYGQLCPILDREGFALHNLASLPHISVAGACATATHGSGSRNANLATAVVGMQIVDGRGKRVDVSRAKQGEKFNGMVVALGGLGAVTAITLRLERRFDVRQEIYRNLPWEQLQRHFDAIMDSAYSVSLFTDWQGPAINQVWLKHRVDHDDGRRAGNERTFYDATPATGPMHPIDNHPADDCTEQMGIVGPWHERLPHFRNDRTPSSGRELQAEYFVPRERAVEALEQINAMRHDIAPLLQVSEIRAIGGDELWMSPCYQAPSVGIHFTWKLEPAAVMAVLGEIEAQLAPLGAYPHWGKLFSVPSDRLAQLYGERFSRFRELLEFHDPKRKFCNAYLARCGFSGKPAKRPKKRREGR